MIEIKVTNKSANQSRLVVVSGTREVLHLDIPRPVDQVTYYKQIAPVLAPMIRSDESYLYVGDERLRMNVEPVTGFMSCGGRNVVDLIQGMQLRAGKSDDLAWHPRNILRSALEFEQERMDQLKGQYENVDDTNKNLLQEHKVSEEEEEDRKTEREILASKQQAKAKTPLQIAREKAARIRKEV